MDRQWGGRGAALAAALVGLALVAAACSSGSSSSKGASSTTTTSTAPAPSVVTTVPSSNTTIPPNLVALKTLMLTVADLPPGWTAQAFRTSNVTAPKGASSCLQDVAKTEAGHTSLVAPFTNAASKLQMSESLVQLPGAPQATQLFHAVHAVLGSCSGTTQTLEPGVTFTITPLTVAGAPQPSTGFQAVASQSRGPSSKSLAVVGAHGPYLWTVSLTGSGSLSTATLSKVATAAVAKLGG